MRSLARVAVVGFVIVLGSQNLPASEVVVSPPVPAAVGAGPTMELPLVIGQTTSSSSSGGSTRIPRGAIRLAIFGAIALIGAAGWVIKKMTAG